MSESRPWLGTPALFLDAYPQVAEIKVESDESGDFPIGQSPHMQHRVLTNNDVGSVLRCSNPLCKQGGLSIQNVVYFMLEAHETYKEFTGHCDGHEGSPKGRRKGAPCSNYFKVKVTIKYKQSDQ
jgi:hypothetical protein